MMNLFAKIRIGFILLLLTAIALLTAMGCANRGSGPQGGPKDVTPPKLLKSTPENHATNYKKPTVELSFDEIVLVENSFEKVIISPPQTTPAVIKALGHKIKVELKDSILPETTYTIDFTDAIVDNNERNKLAGYTFSFSSGDHIDTLKMSGMVIDAETLNPVAGIMVGIHSDMHDSAFTSTAFDRITKTNDKGEFTINNIAAGKYKIFALTDVGNNFLFDLPTEQIAFNDSIYTPECHETVTNDTIYAYETDTITNAIDSTRRYIDTVTVNHTQTFTPDKILLKAFTEKDNRRYLIRTERPQAYCFTMIFSNRCDTLPLLTPLNIDSTAFQYMVQRSANSDTITYWLTDTLAVRQDTLTVESRYLKIDIDSAYTQIDTLKIVYRRPRTNKKNAAKETKNTDLQRLTFQSNGSNKFEIYNDLTISFQTPTVLNDTCSFTLQQKQDTLWKDMKATLIPCDSIGIQYKISYKWQPQATYRLQTDSALFIAINGSCTHAETVSFTIKSLEEYSRLIFTLKNHSGNEIIQILDQNDKPIRQAAVTDGKVTFEYVTPGIYYARLFVDDNGNGTWDPGKYAEKRQAEQVLYFPYDIELRAFWDVEEDWDLTELPLTEQKPIELKKTQTNKK